MSLESLAEGLVLGVVDGGHSGTRSEISTKKQKKNGCTSTYKSTLLIPHLLIDFQQDTGHPTKLGDLSLPPACFGD